MGGVILEGGWSPVVSRVIDEALFRSENVIKMSP